jgi:hypothetical protein
MSHTRRISGPIRHLLRSIERYFKLRVLLHEYHVSPPEDTNLIRRGLPVCAETRDPKHGCTTAPLYLVSNWMLKALSRDFDALLAFIARPLCEVRLVDSKPIYLEVNFYEIMDCRKQTNYCGATYLDWHTSS